MSPKFGIVGVFSRSTSDFLVNRATVFERPPLCASHGFAFFRALSAPLLDNWKQLFFAGSSLVGEAKYNGRDPRCVPSLHRPPFSAATGTTALRFLAPKRLSPLRETFFFFSFRNMSGPFSRVFLEGSTLHQSFFFVRDERGVLPMLTYGWNESLRFYRKRRAGFSVYNALIPGFDVYDFSGEGGIPVGPPFSRPP